MLKTFLKINLSGLLLGLLFYLVTSFAADQYFIQKALNMSDEAFSTMCGFFYLVIFLFITAIVPIISYKWLNGSWWSMILAILWFPYSVLTIFIRSLLPPLFEYSGTDFGLGLLVMFLIFAYPIYILILSLVGTSLKKAAISKV
ncbi:hypothetical protein [Inconstantimicrobium mannanitabidum]|uniref:Uncharacterized protein n=1 Tax=Inconstantimicrobium mannanitabidum TaxID=1604901 RepID=A0ACB5RFT3_9CLOT|nr:hypothetical protein [Clostridium sp. TW13]GKX67951.1 hypothetical protein rsdtw13_32090 [Clostridium sp. TW13]